ncbi:MAG: RDD family protein [Ignavibacteria bacterium]|nr:RDD family protein [Ignavibacteria bacterium]
MKSTQQKRIGAFIIDIVLMGGIISLVEGIFSNFFESQPFELWGLSFNYRFSFAIVVYLCYFFLFDLFKNGRTVGKMVVGVKLLHIENLKLSKRDHFTRSLLKIVSITILPISILLFLFKDHFTIHDQFAKTITVLDSR